jgi:hypothetical protein
MFGMIATKRPEAAAAVAPPWTSLRVTQLIYRKRNFEKQYMSLL